MANKINVVLGLDTTAFQRSIGRVEKQLQQFGSRLESIGSTLSQRLTLPLLAAGAASVKAFADFEKLSKGLAAVMGSSEAAEAELVKLREVAKLPGLGFKEAVQGSVNLQAVGLSADQARQTLRGFGAAIAATGGGAMELGEVQRQLTQIISKNRILQEDYGVLQERVPLIGDALQAAFGTRNIENVRALGVSGQEFVQKISAALIALPKTQNLTGGLANAFENLKDTLFITAAQFGETINKAINLEGIISKIAEVVQRAADGFSSLNPNIQKMILVAGLAAAAAGPLLFAIGSMGKVSAVALIGLRTLVPYIAGPTIFAFKSLQALAVGAAGGLKTFATAAKGVGKAFLAMLGPVTLTVAAIAAVIAGVVYAYSKFEGFRRVINGLGSSIVEIIKIFKEAGAAFIEGFSNLKEGDFKKANENFKKAFTVGIPTEFVRQYGSRVKDAFADGFADDTNYLQKGLDKIKGAIFKTQADVQSGLIGANVTGGASIGASGGGGGGASGPDLQSFESRAQAVFLKLRQSAAQLQTQTANALISPLANVETLESPLKRTEEFFRSWQESVRLAGDQAALFGGTQLEIVQAQVQATGNALSLAVEQFGINSLAVQELGLQYDALKTKLEELAAVQEYATQIQTAFASAWETGAQAVNQAGATIKSVLKAVGRAALQAAADVVRAEIIKGVASVISDALAKFGLLGLAIAGAAGAAAGALFQTAINKIAPPRLARGGLVTSEQLVTVGDNPSGKEAIIPFERMGEFLNMAGGGATRVTGLFEVKGSDLILVLDRAKQEQARVR